MGSSRIGPRSEPSILQIAPLPNHLTPDLSPTQTSSLLPLLRLLPLPLLKVSTLAQRLTLNLPGPKHPCDESCRNGIQDGCNPDLSQREFAAVGEFGKSSRKAFHCLIREIVWNSGPLLDKGFRSFTSGHSSRTLSLLHAPFILAY